jgi:hypothetical protein
MDSAQRKILPEVAGPTRPGTHRVRPSGRRRRPSGEAPPLPHHLQTSGVGSLVALVVLVALSIMIFAGGFRGPAVAVTVLDDAAVRWLAGLGRVALGAEAPTDVLVGRPSGSPSRSCCSGCSPPTRPSPSGTAGAAAPTWTSAGPGARPSGGAWRTSWGPGGRGHAVRAGRLGRLDPAADHGQGRPAPAAVRQAARPQPPAGRPLVQARPRAPQQTAASRIVSLLEVLGRCRQIECLGSLWRCTLRPEMSRPICQIPI